MKLEKFDSNNIPVLVERVLNMWSPENETASFRRIYAEMVIRHNIADNDMQFQIVENGKLRAITFAENKDELNTIESWWQEQYKAIPPEKQEYFKNGRSYLYMMDKKTFSYMNEDDVKLSLFISVEKGWGKQILSEVINLFRSRGYKNMYLWTDCECNIDWYFEHGYELVEKSVYEPYSSAKADYLTYIFRMKL